MGCDDCKQGKNVSWAYVELLNDSHKAIAKRLWITIIILIFVIVVLVGGFIYEHESYEYADIEYTQDGRGINIIGDFNGAEQNYESDFEDPTENP